MGGDHGPAVTVPAALQALQQDPRLRLILVGDEVILKNELGKHRSSSHDHLSIRHATQQVQMDELPSQALRTKKDSSMRVAIDLVKTHEAAACVSAGNTGALMATARFVLKTLPGIDRPAILSKFPTRRGGSVCMLDLGANVDSAPEHLLQFAIMGTTVASTVGQIKNPRVHLLNIGAEDIKGNELVKGAAHLLSKAPGLSYQGYIEADCIYSGMTDVVVCDGFVGNVALKTAEGVAKYISQLIKETFSRNWITRLAALVVLPLLKLAIKRIDPDHYNGASFIGLRGIVIKSHGGASVPAFVHAILEAVQQVEVDVLSHIGHQVENLLKLSLATTDTEQTFYQVVKDVSCHQQ